MLNNGFSANNLRNAEFSARRGDTSTPLKTAVSKIQSWVLVMGLRRSF